MQFQHPGLLYALFLLLIPVLIHLFQLRRFQKVAFTNVAFLKKVTIQTRKSSQLKKWLILLMRLLAFACIIIAFAQPYQASQQASVEKEFVIYVDNSFSMTTKGAQGPLLQRSLQQLYEEVENIGSLSWFTNTSEKRNSSISDFQRDILAVEPVAKQLSTDEVLLKAEQLFSNDSSISKRFIYISDFQDQQPPTIRSNHMKVDMVQLLPVTKNNISIDSAYISSKNVDNISLEVKLSASGEVSSPVAASLYNGESLIAKTAVDFSEGLQNTIRFDLENPGEFRGKISIVDPSLLYDNDLFLALNKTQKIRVLSISDASNDFLDRLFNSEEFELTQQNSTNLNYNELPSQNFIILNEVEIIPPSLNNALDVFIQGGGSLLIIPSNTADIATYNELLEQLQIGSYTNKLQTEKKITQIGFAHLLFENVFEKRVVNFQYPKVNSFYTINSNASRALRFEDDQPFLLQKNKIYISTSAWNTENSNFKSSPLIVPTIYNMAVQSLPLPKLYYTIDQKSEIAIATQMGQDEILTLKAGDNSFIPIQQTKENQVLITTDDQPSTADVYQVFKEDQILGNLAYNYDRTESALQYAQVDEWNGFEKYRNIPELFESIRAETSNQSFWKWFVIFALLFLLAEMLILKFYR
jgi:hypothetical protein